MKRMKRMKSHLAMVGDGVWRSQMLRTPRPARGSSPRPQLADQIAAILGPGQAHLTIRNLSSISTMKFL